MKRGAAAPSEEATMELTALAGNAQIKAQLAHREGDLAHAYIVAGPAGSGRHTLAAQMAAALVCSAQPQLRPCGRCSHCRKAARGHPSRHHRDCWQRRKTHHRGSGPCPAHRRLCPSKRGGAEGVPVGAGRPDERQRPERHAQAAGGRPRLCGLFPSGGERLRPAAHGALPM